MELFLNLLLNVLVIAIAVIPITTAILHKPKIKAPKTLKKIWRNFTLWGKIVVFCAIVWSFLYNWKYFHDFNKSEQEKHENELAQQSLRDKLDQSYDQQLTTALNEKTQYQQQLDTLARLNSGLAERDIAQFQYMTSLQQNLDKWGLTISDSFIVKQRQANPLLETMNFFIDSNYRAELSLCNMGSGEAYNVKIYFGMLQFHPLIANSVVMVNSKLFSTIDISSNTCYDISYFLDRRNPLLFKYVYFLTGTYFSVDDPMEKVFSTLWRWDAITKNWGQVPTPKGPRRMLEIAKAFAEN